MKFIITVTVCLASIAGAIDNGFPDDPAGVEIIDRAFYRDFYNLDEVLLYLRLFNDGDQGTIELFRGVSDGLEYNWELIYSWKPELYGGGAFAFLPVCVISIQSCDNTLLITWIEKLYTEYYEGLGSLYLEYDLENGEINDFLVD